jgi:hypothetical protein
MNSERTIQVQLTREQELQIAAATGLLIGALDLDLTETPDGESVTARIPEAMVTTESSRSRTGD